MSKKVIKLQKRLEQLRIASVGSGSSDEEVVVAKQLFIILTFCKQLFQGELQLHGGQLSLVVLL